MNLLQNHPLKNLHTFGLDATTRYFANITNISELQEIVQAPALQNLPRFILGEGSNTLPSPLFEGVVLRINLKGRAYLGEDENHHYLQAAAGENWHTFVQWTLAQGWPGLENLSLIPGTVGAAPIQNIGAYGLELAERIHNIQTLDLRNGQTHTLSAKNCAFGYRDSIFKQNHAHVSGHVLITHVNFCLPKHWHPQINYAELATTLKHQNLHTPSPQEISDTIIQIRQQKLPNPQYIGNAGSFFKNPSISPALAHKLQLKYPTLKGYPQQNGQVKLAAAWLIEQAGWKGKTLGPVGMFKNQALVMVRHAPATLNDVKKLSEKIQEDVSHLFDIFLEPEPVFL